MGTYSSAKRMYIGTFKDFPYSVTSYLGPFIRVLASVELFFSGIWSLDFLKVTNIVPPFCISDRITNLNALLFEYILVVHPIFLVLITYLCIELHARNYRILVFLWKPFRSLCIRIRRKWVRQWIYCPCLCYSTPLIFQAQYCSLQPQSWHSSVYSEWDTFRICFHIQSSKYNLQFKAYSLSSDSSYRLILSRIRSSSATLPLSHSAIQESHTALLQLQKENCTEYICRDISRLL